MKELFYTVNLINHEYWVAVYIGRDFKKVEKRILKHFEGNRPDDMEMENFRGKCWMRSGFAPFIFVNTKYCKTNIKICATLAHEAFHAIEHIFETIGESYKGEIPAHSISIILKEFEYYKNK